MASGNAAGQQRSTVRCGRDLGLSLTPGFSRVACGWSKQNGFNRFRVTMTARVATKPLKRFYLSAPSHTGMNPGVNINGSRHRIERLPLYASCFSHALHAKLLSPQ
jgi:hypothetical protein